MGNQHKRNSRELLKEQCIEYLGGKRCAICEADYLPICCYDFHHDEGAKEENISKILARNRKITDELKVELDKCIVVCANCHRMITYGYITEDELWKMHFLRRSKKRKSNNFFW